MWELFEKLEKRENLLKKLISTGGFFLDYLNKNILFTIIFFLEKKN